VSLGDGFRLDLLAVSLDLGVTARFRRGARGTGYLRCCCGSSVRFCELVESADNKLLMQKKKEDTKGDVDYATSMPGLLNLWDWRIKPSNYYHVTVD
jgi:hypothetical protein